MAYLCKNCNAPVEFNPQSGLLECKYCEHKFRTQEYANFSINTSIEKEEQHFFIYRCNNCGAEVIADKDSMTSKCIYCGTNLTFINKKEENFHPDKIVPFKLTKDQAFNQLKNYIKGRDLINNNFVKNISLKEINGYYLPFYMFNGNITSKGLYSFSGMPTILYEAIFNDFIESYIVNASDKVNDEIVNTISNFETIVDFNPSYMLGFMAEKAKKQKPSCFKIFYEQAKKQRFEDIEQSISSKERKDSDDTRTITELKSFAQINNIQINYLLCPFYIITIQNDGKLFKAMVNGENGETAGVFPVDHSKYMAKEIGFYFAFFIGVIILFGIRNEIALNVLIVISSIIALIASYIHIFSTLDRHIGFKEKKVRFTNNQVLKLNRRNLHATKLLPTLDEKKDLLWNDFNANI